MILQTISQDFEGPIGLVNPNTGAFSTLSTNSTATLFGAVRQYGTMSCRIENTGGDAPGATGQGLDLYVYSGNSIVRSYNYTTTGYTPLALNASSIYLQNAGTTVATVSSTGLTVAGFLATNGNIYFNTTGCGIGYNFDAAGKSISIGYGNGGTTNFGAFNIYDGKTSIIASFTGGGSILLTNPVVTNGLTTNGVFSATGGVTATSNISVNTTHSISCDTYTNYGTTLIINAAGSATLALQMNGSSVLSFAGGTTNAVFAGSVSATTGTFSSAVILTGSTGSVPGSVGVSATLGLTLWAKAGVSWDFTIYNAAGSGSPVMGLTFGSSVPTFPYGLSATSGTFTGAILGTTSSSYVFMDSYLTASYISNWSGSNYLGFGSDSTATHKARIGMVTSAGVWQTAPGDMVLQVDGGISATTGTFSGVGTFSNTSPTGGLLVTGNQPSTTTSSGSLVVTGGVGISGSACLGNKLNLASYANISPAVGDIWFDPTQQTLVAYTGASGNGYKTYTSGILATIKSSATITFTTAGVYTYSLLPYTSLTPTYAITLPANWWVVGKTIRISMYAQITPTGTGYLIVKPVLQGSTVYPVQSATMTSGESYQIKLEILLTCQMMGGVGTATWNYSIKILVDTTVPGTAIGSGVTTGLWAGIATTASSTLDIQAGMSAGANNSFVTWNGVIEALN